MWRSILVSVDLSDGSELLIKEAHRLATDFSAKLYILHVVQFRKVNINYAIAFPIKKLAYEQLEENARCDIDAILPKEKDNIEVIIKRGEPEKSILDLAKLLGVDLIIMDGSKHSFLRHLVRGRWRCLNSQIASKSSAPVLLINVKGCFPRKSELKISSQGYNKKS
ncbi:MAG: universal stress protein [Sedimentisphaerales bacterium]|jgi:nucleotide-binding universal stress UspA family protein|nr:universal stress protein [Sedimentisphaerales bacterium]